VVLSASRRTDLPAFYLDWLLAGIEAGFLEVDQPYSGRLRRVPLAPERVHSIVFWSKDFGPFLRVRAGEKLRSKGYASFFNFTLNSESPLLEPRVPPLSHRLRQLSELSGRFGPERIPWRVDPICFFKFHGSLPEDRTPGLPNTRFPVRGSAG